MTALAKVENYALSVPGVVSRVGLQLPDDLSFNDWCAVGRELLRAEGSVLWWLGDWWAFGESKYGERVKLVEDTGYAFQTLANAGWLARKFESSRRREVLTWSHHLEVARLDPVSADVWLDRAESNKWSQKQLRQAIKQDKLLSLQAAAAAQSGNGIGTIAHCSYPEFLPGIADGSVDLLLTDPPYMTDVENIESFCKWVELALPKVKSTGRAYIWTGAYADELSAYLNVLRPWCAETGWDIGNVLVWTYRNTMGPSPGRVYKQNWQACFYLVGPDAGPLDCDLLIEKFTVFDIAAPMDGRLHTWQKPDELGEMIVRHASKPGDVVLDCFAGTGTFLSAAIRQGRNAVGCDADAKMVDLCVRRGLRRE